MAHPRLFVAIALPERVRGALDRSLDPWREALKGVRWGPPENWHVTLLFLGATDPERIPRIEAQLADVTGATSAFGTSVDGLGGFPSTQRATILWAGLADDEGRIARLAASLASALGTQIEHDPFSAHITVGRAKRPVRLPAGSTAECIEGSGFEVTELVLVRSHLGAGPPRYETLARLPFGTQRRGGVRTP